MHKKRRVARLPVTTLTHESSKTFQDLIIAEEPLTILWEPSDGPSQKLTATMRTPGHDNELTAGLLYSEGLLLHKDELNRISFCGSGGPNELNRLRVKLHLTLAQAQSRLAHRPFQPSHSQPQSSCGMCSHDELPTMDQLVEWAASKLPSPWEAVSPTQSALEHALSILQTEAPLFASTGASHAVAIIDASGHALAVAEDVGRHNACDKALGELLLKAKGRERFALPAGSGILFSSRLSFELAAKAVRAGAAWMASVGAPTDLALKLARVVKLPTIGFLSSERHNVYVS